MSMFYSTAKNLVENLPRETGFFLSWLPFTLRLGVGYSKSCFEIQRFDKKSVELQQQYTFYRLQKIVWFAYKNIPFYRDIYEKYRFNPSCLESMSDWNRVPIITKSDLQNSSIDHRSISTKGLNLINTGGTSGQPLEFYLDSNAFAREWAHMHFVWKARGYRQTHIKLTFRGKHFDRSQPLRYNAVHNEYIVNANCPMVEIVEAVLDFPNKYTIRWLHGYPSLIAEFALEMIKCRNNEASRFRARLFGVLLGSEYPAPIYREAISNILSSNIVTWYGHSEMSILARETSRGLYESLPSYGFAESVATDNGGAHRLICTSYYNKNHPFIRYDTGDLIEPVSKQPGSLSFRITEGRVGDFLKDRKGNKHSLTAVIFGRHHNAFGQLRHLQVRDNGGGQITLVITPRDFKVSPYSLLEGFDLNDLDIDLTIEVVNAPVRSEAGKIRLKID